MKRILFAATLFVSLFAVLGDAEAHRYRRYRYHTHGYTYGYGAGYYQSTAYVAPMMIMPSWYLGLGLAGLNVLDQQGGPEPLENGGGASLFLGVRLSSMFAIEVGWLGTFHNPRQDKWFPDETDFLALEGFTADVRLHLSRCARSSGCFDPYVQGGVGLYALGSSSFGLDSIGTGFQAGGGFDFWLGPSWTLGLRAKYHGVALGPPEGDEADLFIHAASLEGNVAFHF